MTQDRSAFEQDVHRAWADHLGYPIALASQSGTTILPEAKHAGDKLIALWRIGARTFAQVDPQLADAVRRVADAMPASEALIADDLARAVADSRRADYALQFFDWCRDAVEDAADSSGLVWCWLGEAGNFHVVAVAGDGETAVAHATRFKPDVMVLDLDMPGVDGAAALG